jgi:hypothetical protein
VQIDDFLDIGEDEEEIAEALEEHGPLAIAINAFGMQVRYSKSRLLLLPNNF